MTPRATIVSMMVNPSSLRSARLNASLPIRFCMASSEISAAEASGCTAIRHNCRAGGLNLWPGRRGAYRPRPVCSLLHQDPYISLAVEQRETGGLTLSAEHHGDGASPNAE